ncbi:MAG: biotin--[acetyl-CoA-carboxylase] ligase [Clostridiales bacterium]|nr:biotin--[acetyl-CoA-carboxylase] ligase [Clostridiales bacterium]
MNIKEQVLKQLEENRGSFVSGKALADSLFYSRNAVWKAVRSLISEGHKIDAVTNKGYRLSEYDRILTKAGIEKYLTDPAADFKVMVFKETASTNALLKQYGEENHPEGLIIAADRQTAGKGRSSRSFYSPSDTGIYFSLLLRPKGTAEASLFITTAAAAAASEGIEKVTGIKTGIKWVNDIIYQGKKIAGILTEASVDMETGGLSYAVLGIGINVSDPEGGFPEEIREIAGSLYGSKPCPGNIRSRLVGEIITIFTGYYKNLSDKKYMDIYRERSVVIGKQAEAYSGKGSFPIKILSIDDDGALIAERENREIIRLNSGEIRLRNIEENTEKNKEKEV